MGQAPVDRNRTTLCRIACLWKKTHGVILCEWVSIAQKMCGFGRFNGNLLFYEEINGFPMRFRAVPAVTALAMHCALAAPYTPTDDNVVLERLPVRATDPVQREIRRLRAAHEAAPLDPEPAIALARRYFGLALAQGDPRYIGYGEAALRPWPDPALAPVELLIVRAQLAQYRHEFNLALEYLDRVLAAEPQDPEALAWRAAVHMVQADYARARIDCGRLAEVASELLATGCAAFVEATTGRLRPAYDRLLAALQRDPDARPTLRLWVLTLLADMARRLDRASAAEAHYREAIDIGLTDQYLLAAYGEFLLAQRRWTDVVALLRPWERSDMLLLVLARAERALGARDAERHAKALQARYEASTKRGERLHIQDEAQFRLEFMGDAKGALALAIENWSRQREPRDAELLLQAALAAREPAAAQPALDWLAASGYEDPRLARLAEDLAKLKR